jgi:hypothetical protein
MKAFLQYALRPRKPGKTRGNNMERWVFGRGSRQERQYFRHLDEAPWPCVESYR